MKLLIYFITCCSWPVLRIVHFNFVIVKIKVLIMVRHKSGVGDQSAERRGKTGTRTSNRCVGDLVLLGQ